MWLVESILNFTALHVKQYYVSHKFDASDFQDLIQIVFVFEEIKGIDFGQINFSAIKKASMHKLCMLRLFLLPKNLRRFIFLHGFGQFRYNLKQVADDAVIRRFEKRCFRIAVNHDDNFTVIHACQMLNSTADTCSNI